MHLAGGIKIGSNDMRFDKKLTIKVPTTSGDFVEKNFRFNKN